MLDADQRTAILTLAAQGHSRNMIAEAVGVSRNTVKKVLREGDGPRHTKPRLEQAGPHAERIVAQYARCEGNLVRVQEELVAEHIVLAYSTLTAFCRRHGIGVEPRAPTGRYEFAPGQEMQHDTSPHRVKVAEKERLVQCAALVLCHSRMLYAQVFANWNRFWCKVFLTEALRYLGGAAGACMIDNSHVVIAHGTGPDAVAAPEMAAFAKHFGFYFIAHAVGHAERSGRVERPFHFIEHNFYPGRTFADLEDVNRQLRAWCEAKNASYKKHLCAVPVSLFALERTVLKPLPIHIPEVELIHVRTVDSEGFITLHNNRYSVLLGKVDVIGRQTQVHEGKDRVRVFLCGKELAAHARREDNLHSRSTLVGHHDGRRWRSQQAEPVILEQERLLRACSPVLVAWLEAARAKGRGNGRVLRRLHRMWLEYPREPLEAAMTRATAHALFDLERVETMVLRELGEFFFRLDPAAGDPGPGDDNDDP